MESAPEPSVIVLFDGVCNLCNGTVRFAYARDPAARLRFAPLQSAVGRRLIAGAGLPAAQSLDSLVVVERGTLRRRSDAALAIARHLRWPWPLLGALAVVPRALRDAVYDLIARRRYLWFGRSAACPMPPPGLRGRFLPGSLEEVGQLDSPGSPLPPAAAGSPEES
jgi:predicted DCC family thiol-disulfide oxidoreductase YuxK